MANDKVKICKTKVCNNPVLDGKYCEYCKQKRKENKNKGLAVAVAVGIPAVSAAGYAIKKGALKQIPKIAGKIIQVVLKR
ncbi:hypothetical protein FACS1894196_0400 [Clostridia bacterium]|nr:hypothetical protein FACS1894196_0400 [Clostridia bacterium]